MSQIILCISDHPEHFKTLRNLAFVKNIVVVTNCRLFHILEYLRGPDTIVGITLDFEMPFGTGAMFVKYFNEEKINIPIVITEKDKHGVKRIAERLKEIEYQNYIVLPYDQDDWERNAFDFWFPVLVPEIIKLSELIFNSNEVEQ